MTIEGQKVNSMHQVKNKKKTVIIDELYKSIFFCDFVVVEIRMH